MWAATARRAAAAGRSGATATNASPWSAVLAISTSNGTRPRNGTPTSRASASTSGPGKRPAMFSTRPSTGARPCPATVNDFRTTSCETSDGIVTTTVPASTGTSDVTVRSRSVPGGRSISSTSSVPQSVSARNSRSAFASIVPRHVWASSWVGASQVSGAESDGSRRSIDITFTPSALRGGSTPPARTTSFPPRTPSIFAIVGPLRSASSTPTCRPSNAKQAARFAVTEDLPTPPLPDTIATIARTRLRRSRRRACCASTWPTMLEPPSPAMSR